MLAKHDCYIWFVHIGVLACCFGRPSMALVDLVVS